MSDSPNKLKASLVEKGNVGLDYSLNGDVYEEFDRSLQGAYGIKTYKEMANNDSTIGAMLFAIEQLLQGVKWFAEPASKSERHIKEAEMLQTIMDDMDKTFNEVVVDVSDFLTYGWSLAEPVFKIRKGPTQSNPKFRSKYNDHKWGLRKIPVRSQDTLLEWIFDDEGCVTGMKQLSPNSSKITPISMDRLLHFRVNTKRDNPESRSILRTAYRAWSYKKLIEDQEAIGVSRDLAGIPIMYAPMNIMSTDAQPDEVALRNTLEDVVTSIHNNTQAGVLLPDVRDEHGNRTLSLELLSSSGKRLFDTDKIITRYQANIAQTVLADFIMLGQVTHGSFALSSNKTKLFSTAMSAWLSSVGDPFNKKLVPKLGQLNGWDIENLPKIGHSDLESRDLAPVADYFEKLGKHGFIRPDEELEDYLRETAEAPKFNSEKQIIPAPTDAASGTNSQAGTSNVASNVATNGKPTGDAIA